MSGSSLHISAVSRPPIDPIPVQTPCPIPIEAWGVHDTPIIRQSSGYKIAATVNENREPEHHQRHFTTSDRINHYSNSSSKMTHTQWHHRGDFTQSAQLHRELNIPSQMAPRLHEKNLSHYSSKPWPQQSPSTHLDNWYHSSLMPGSRMKAHSFCEQQEHPTAQGYPPSSQLLWGQNTGNLLPPAIEHGMFV